MSGNPETPQQQPQPDEQLKPDEQSRPDEQLRPDDQDDGQRKPGETPPRKPKGIFDPRYCVDLTEKEAGRGFGIVGARDPRKHAEGG